MSFLVEYGQEDMAVLLKSLISQHDKSHESKTSSSEEELCFTIKLIERMFMGKCADCSLYEKRFLCELCYNIKSKTNVYGLCEEAIEGFMYVYKIAMHGQHTEYSYLPYCQCEQCSYVTSKHPIEIIYDFKRGCDCFMCTTELQIQNKLYVVNTMKDEIEEYIEDKCDITYDQIAQYILDNVSVNEDINEKFIDTYCDIFIYKLLGK